MDGSEVIYSIGPQTQVPGGGFAPSGEVQGAVIRTVNSLNPVSIGLLPGVNAGFFPSNPMVANSGGGDCDLSQTPLSLVHQGADRFILSASGLNPAATYRLESSTDLVTFGNGQNFSGQQVMSGVTIESQASRMFYRLTTVP